MMSDIALTTVEAALPLAPQPSALTNPRTGLVLVDVVKGFRTVGCGALAPSEPDE